MLAARRRPGHHRLVNIELQLRDLQTGNTSHRAFDSTSTCKAWLKDRPKFTEVIGLRSKDVPDDVNDELKAACRPLDAEETTLSTQLEQALEAAHRSAAEARRKEEEAAAAKHREEMANLPPNAPMKLRYLFNKGVATSDATDTRTPSEACLEAVKAWVEERNTWVEGRGQVVGDANLEVYPGALPEGVESPIISGTFIPVTAPAKD